MMPDLLRDILSNPGSGPMRGQDLHLLTNGGSGQLGVMAILDCRARVAAAIIIIKCNKKGPGPLYSLGSNVGLEIRSAMPLINVCSPQVYKLQIPTRFLCARCKDRG